MSKLAHAGASNTTPSGAARRQAVCTASASESASADPMAALIEAAKAEGTLTTIALPDDWCNYREMIDTFKAKYGLMVNELDPNAGSNDELEAIKANKDTGIIKDSFSSAKLIDRSVLDEVLKEIK